MANTRASNVSARPEIPASRIKRARYDDASWVAWRLAEALALEQTERQLLLQMSDPVERLKQLMHYLPRFQGG